MHPFVVPLAVALFFFILFANWLELLPTEINHDVHLLPAPTADTNLTYAMALMAMVGVWIYGISEKGAKGYFKHFLEPFPVLLPLNILEELTKPITLALRLFGNIFAGGIMLALIGLIPFYAIVGPEPGLEAVRHVHRRYPGVHLRSNTWRCSAGAAHFNFSILVLLAFRQEVGGSDARDSAANDDDVHLEVAIRARESGM